MKVESNRSAATNNQPNSSSGAEASSVGDIDHQLFEGTWSPQAPKLSGAPMTILTVKLPLEAQAADDASRGRTTFAGDGTVLAAYAGEDDKARRWDGDWTNIPYPPFETGQPAELVNYLCQRVLDLTAQNNPTLTPSQKAELFALVHNYEGQHQRFSVFLRAYLEDGDVSIADLRALGGTDNDVNGDLASAEVNAMIKAVAEKITQLEKQADMPNADMRDSNALMNDMGLYASTSRGEGEQERRPTVWSGSNTMNMANGALNTLIGLGRPV